MDFPSPTASLLPAPATPPISAPSFRAAQQSSRSTRLTIAARALSSSPAISPQPGGFHVTQPQSTNIASGSSTTPAVTLPNSTANTFSGNVNPTNDPATGQVPTTLFISRQPADSAPGQTMAAVDVEVEDLFGHLVTSANSDITLAIAMGPDGATLAGTTTVAAVNGVATFSDLSLPFQGTYTLAASDGNLAAATSNSFTVARPATQLVLFQQPASATTASALGLIVIDVEDSDGNLVADNNSNVTLAVASGPKGALAGTTTVTAVNGVATFSNLSFTKAGTYTLRRRIFFDPRHIRRYHGQSSRDPFGVCAATTTTIAGQVIGLGFNRPSARSEQLSPATIDSAPALALVNPTRHVERHDLRRASSWRGDLQRSFLDCGRTLRLHSI